MTSEISSLEAPAEAKHFTVWHQLPLKWSTKSTRKTYGVEKDTINKNVVNRI